ncbi:F-box protein At5g07610 [Daucus carota subsp. sativus]|uniref:F-box protein At5g07610 n=1 Tax=Daucus carota subsp. sativus TaxID=79200 RepID=UPI003083D2B8
MKLGLSSPADQREKDVAIIPVTSAVQSFPCILKRRCIVSDPSSEVLESADLLREILVKLPPKTVFGFTLVSSHWNKTITDPELTCLLKVPRNPSAVFVRRLVLQEDHDVVKYTHIPLEGVTRGGRVRVRRSPLSLNLMEEEEFNQASFVIQHSSNGLMICSSCNGRRYFLFNPTTKKRVKIPLLINFCYWVISMHISFLAPGRHKIIAVYLPTYRGDRLKLLVLEPNQNQLQYWRNTGVEFPVTGTEVVNYWYGVDVDGVIYWPCYKSSGLMFFDVREETVHWLPEVPHPYDKFSGLAYFGECKGNLCMVADVSMRRGTFDMLELKTDRSMWFIKYHIDLTGRVSRDENLQILVLALLPGVEEESDSYLVIHFLREVVSINLRDGTIRKLCDLGLRTTESRLLRSETWHYVHPYRQNPVYPRLTAS